ncbi:hypothetical protein RDI58_014926 [Solanum bulbocastanum]|uniref:Uncharacterized protein n=1 Tax=Solanum bulbocastanum TaxID=147425 RepID=A0AAN8YCD3_SOLBU
MTQSITDESEVSPNDVIGKVLGKEHFGRVRCLVLGVVPSRAFKQTRPPYSDLNASSENNDSCSSQCQDKSDIKSKNPRKLQSYDECSHSIGECI